MARLQLRFPPSLPLLVTVAGGALLGLQLLRALFPLLVYVARDRFGLSSAALGSLAAVLFSTAFLFPALLARREAVRAVAGSVVALAILRLALQLWAGDPAGSLGIAAAGTLALLAFLAAVPRVVGMGPVAAALLAGAAADASIHALAGTRDLHWGGTAATGATLLVVAVILAGALALLRGGTFPAPRIAAAPALLAWGPWLLLQLELLGNVARLSSRTGSPSGLSGAWIAAGLGLAAIAATRLARARPLTGGGLPLLAAAALVPSLVRSESVGAFAPIPLIVAQVAAALLLARALAAPPPAAGARGPGIACGAGFLAFLALVFGHYAGYDLPLPGSRLLWLLVAAAILTLAAARARPPATPGAPVPLRPLLVLTVLLAALPLLRRPPAPRPDARPGDVVRVVTFNLHNGFDEQGRFALDGMLDRLAADHPDVVALQEVSRGWLVNGGADLFELARERLVLHGVFGPAVSTDWGNAILTRFPPDSTRLLPLPPRDLPLTRQATIADLPAGPAGVPLRVIATHFHHVEADERVRVVHAEELARLGAPRGGLLLGDFNAPPDSPSFAILRGAGWQDAAAASPEPTYPARAPLRRIDTILAGRGSRILDARVAPPWGSDHRAVIVDFRP